VLRQPVPKIKIHTWLYETHNQTELIRYIYITSAYLDFLLFFFLRFLILNSKLVMQCLRDAYNIVGRYQIVFREGYNGKRIKVN